MFVNTELFRTEATYFQKYNRYPDGVEGTPEWFEYWREQELRCIEGYSVGGIHITGYHYFYLNFCPIQVTRKTYGEVHKNKKSQIQYSKKTGTRVEDFPDFWDVDWMYWTVLDIARFGMDLETYKKLPIDLNIQPHSLDGGRHLIWLKPRGVGASFKGGAASSRNYHILEKTKTYMFAYAKEFLTKDGIWQKFLDVNSWLNKNASGFRRNAKVKADRNNMHYRASFVNADNEEEGRLNEVIGVTLGDDIQKARGKRGILILMEELGKFPGADTAFEIARSSVEENDVTFGTIVGFGTGGTEEADYAALDNLINNPDAFNCVCFDNVYDPNSPGGDAVGFFTPAYMDVGKKDKDGNSLKEVAKDFYDAQREKARQSKDPTLLPKRMAEKPYTIEEATLSLQYNQLPIADIKTWYSTLMGNKHLKSIGVHGNLVEVVATPKYPQGVKFSLSNKVYPVPYPAPKGVDLSGCITIYQPPYKNEKGEVPQNLYFIAHDPYALDTKKGLSLGAAYVIKRVNNFSQPDNMIVAEYVGRPQLQEEYNENLFKLARFYNAKIGFENDRGNVKEYAQRTKQLHWLMSEVEIIDKGVHIRKLGRSYGMSMGSQQRSAQAELYLRDWLIEKRGKKENGEFMLNLHKIYSPGLLKEMMKYRSDGKGNFDRISALKVGMFYMKDLYKKTVKENTQTLQEDGFFNRQFFQ